ncbi:MAG: hypothetical protein NT062_05410 [Proteobacteria bacterium]|nr:hypothetical protein [Pseudomonadota bacterium]
MRARLLQLLVLLASSCRPSPPDRQLDFAQISVTRDAKMRTDVLGEGRFAETSTFVLVDAENTAGEGAYVTLTGVLADAAGAKVAQLKAQSLWIPAHASRTFALVDEERKPRPTAVGAAVEVKGAAVTGFTPVAKLSEVKSLDDVDKVVMQAMLENPSDRLGKIVVIASFHDKDGTPMTRPFDLVTVQPKEKVAVQFVGPRGSKRGAIYLGDEAY